MNIQTITKNTHRTNAANASMATDTHTPHVLYTALLNLQVKKIKNNRNVSYCCPPPNTPFARSACVSRALNLEPEAHSLVRVLKHSRTSCLYKQRRHSKARPTQNTQHVHAALEAARGPPRHSAQVNHAQQAFTNQKAQIRSGLLGLCRRATVLHHPRLQDQHHALEKTRQACAQSAAQRHLETEQGYLHPRRIWHDAARERIPCRASEWYVLASCKETSTRAVLSTCMRVPASHRTGSQSTRSSQATRNSQFTREQPIALVP